GLIKWVAKGNFVGVVCEREEQAIRAARDLKVTWEGSQVLPPMSELHAVLRRIPSNDRAPANTGDVEGTLAGATKTLNATYHWPFQLHASIGPFLQAAAKRASWISRPSPQKVRPGTGINSGRGIAFVQYDRTEAYVPAVAEVDVTPVDGQVRVKRVVVAHDCGLIINPDGLRNQIEGNVIQATSRTLKEEVKYDGSMLTSLDWI